MIKRGISKNYFYWEPTDEQKIFDQRIVDKYVEENKNPTDSALDYNDTETKILIYEDMVKEWFLEIANRLKQDNEAGFVILQIALSYIEGNQQYREGEISKKKSKSFFIKAMKRIFPEITQIENVNIDNLLSEFYYQVRCGLFHDSMTRRLVTISGNFGDTLVLTASEIRINPHNFLDHIYSDFEEYVMQLKDKNKKELRKKFEDRWMLTG